MHARRMDGQGGTVTEEEKKFLIAFLEDHALFFAMYYLTDSNNFTFGFKG